MKLAAVLKTIAPFLATDKKPEDVLAAVLAADKAAKDAAGSGLGSRELEEKDKPNGDKGAKDKSAKDKGAKDRDDDPEGTNAADEDVDAEDEKDEDADDEGDPSTPGGSRAGGKTAIDSAEVDRRIAKAVATRDALHTALREVEPIVGVIAADSAGEAYRAALTKLGVDTKGVHNSALRSMLNLAKDKAKTSAAPVVAMDSATAKGMDAIIPGYSRLR